MSRRSKAKRAKRGYLHGKRKPMADAPHLPRNQQRVVKDGRRGNVTIFR